MDCLVLVSLLIYFPCLIMSIFDHNVQQSCSEEESECTFHLHVNYLMTMVWFNWTTYEGSPVYYRNGSFCKKNRKACSIDNENCFQMTDQELRSVVTTDGSYRLMYGINNQFPGPSIVVYEGQTVVVHVYNEIVDDDIVFHWHGIQQKNTAWMDGVSMVTQYPILPNQNFTYRFEAYPSGSHWYHSHFGAQRASGLAGAFIVLPRAKKIRTDIPKIDGDFLFLIQDWFPTGSDIFVTKIIDWHMVRFAKTFGQNTCFSVSRALDGNVNGQYPYESGLINGKANPVFTNSSSVTSEKHNIPMEIFSVQKGSYYRFRIMNFGLLNPFRLFIDQHTLKIISSDGADLNPVKVDSLIILPGETFDVLLHANAEEGNYWIRMETLDVMTVKFEPREPNVTYAHLHYTDAELKTPTSKKVDCSSLSPCILANCPWGQLVMDKNEPNTQCIPIADMTSTESMLVEKPVPIPTSPEEFNEKFFDFHSVSNGILAQKEAVNARHFIYPTFPLLMYPERASSLTSRCNESRRDCNNKSCRCTQIIQLPFNSVVQLVLSDMDDAGDNPLHPVHLHGYRFHVLKIGYQIYNETTGLKSKANEDLVYSENFRIQTWSNASWLNDNVPGLNLINPPLKDTVLVPRYGYAVIRFRADNPGGVKFYWWRRELGYNELGKRPPTFRFWLAHCHAETHQLIGMTVALQVGTPDEIKTYLKRTESNDVENTDTAQLNLKEDDHNEKNTKLLSANSKRLSKRRCLDDDVLVLSPILFSMVLLAVAIIAAAASYCIVIFFCKSYSNGYQILVDE